MKKKILLVLTVVFVLALIAVPAFAAMNDQQKTEIDTLYKQISELQKQIVDKYVDAGNITKAQADAAKANIDAAEQYRQQYSQQNSSSTPIPGYGSGFGPGGYGPGQSYGWGPSGGYYGGYYGCW